MKNRIVDEEIRLVPYYPNDKTTLAWYQDLTLCKQVDNRDTAYDLDMLCLLYTSPSPRDMRRSRMPSSA